MQPWTEDPDVAIDATAPTRRYGAGSRGFVASLASMQDVAGSIARLAPSLSIASKELRQTIGFMGDLNITTRHVDAAQAPKVHPELREHFDLITARAVAMPDVVAPLAFPMLAKGGRLVLWLDEGTEPPRSLPGLRLEGDHPYVLPEPAARNRRLACYRRA